MPKMKTNSAASKRAKITGTGKVKRLSVSAMRHNLEHKSARKRCELSADGCCAAARPRSCTSFCRSEHRAYPEITRL